MCIHVSSEIEEAAKDAGDITVKRQKETIKKLAREVAACDSIAKAQQEMMQQQKDEINHLKKHMKNMASKMKEMEESISKSIAKQFINFEKKVEKIINNQTSTLETNAEKTFANVVKYKSTNSTPDIKSIIKETNVEQHREENEKKKRETNIVIHGVPENNFNSKEEEFEYGTKISRNN